MYELPHELPKDLRLQEGLKEIRKFQKNPWNAWIWRRVRSCPNKTQIWVFSVKSRKKAAVKQSIEKPALLNLVNLSSTPCPRLYSKSLPINYSYQILLSPHYIVAAQSTPYRHSFQLFYQLLLANPISYSYQLLATVVVTTRYCISYSLLYQLLF